MLNSASHDKYEMGLLRRFFELKDVEIVACLKGPVFTVSGQSFGLLPFPPVLDDLADEYINEN